MCDYEEIVFLCGHRTKKLLSYCHFARTDPLHQCFGVKVIKATWTQNISCQTCIDAVARAQRGQRRR